MRRVNQCAIGVGESLEIEDSILSDSTLDPKQFSMIVLEESPIGTDVKFVNRIDNSVFFVYLNKDLSVKAESIYEEEFFTFRLQKEIEKTKKKKPSKKN